MDNLRTVPEQYPDNTQHPIDNIRLTCSEIGFLWTSYMGDSMTMAINTYFVQKTKDPQVRSVIQFALESAKSRLQTVTNMFNTIQHPVPQGFGISDLNINVRQLYSDTFMLLYAKYSTRFRLFIYNSALSMTTRVDVREFFDSVINSTKENLKQIDDLLLQKGLYVRPPYIPIPEMVEFVANQGFIANIAGVKRPLNSLEIAYLFNNIQINNLGKALLLGLSQVAKSKKVKDYVKRGEDIAEKHLSILGEFLEKDDLPISMNMDQEVSDSTESPFSDKLSLFLVSSLIVQGVNEYGFSLACSSRFELATTYSRLIVESLKYSEDGMELLTHNGWLEKIPEQADRKQLYS